MRVDRKRRGKRPEAERAGIACPQGPPEEGESERDEEDHERVGPRLLRVPDQVGVQGHEGRAQESHPARDQLAASQVGGRHGERPDQGRERPKPNLARAEEARPGPREDVVERRAPLAGGNVLQRVKQVGNDHPTGGNGLVVVEALQAERGEASDRGHDHDSGEESQLARARALAGFAWEIDHGTDDPRSRPAGTAPSLGWPVAPSAVHDSSDCSLRPRRSDAISFAPALGHRERAQRREGVTRWQS